MIDWQPILLAAIGSSALSAFITAWFLRRNEKDRIRVEAKKVVSADWQAFAGALSARVASLEQRLAESDEKREADAITKRRMGDHIDVLESHIWKGLGPPPPPRPDGI